MAFRSYVCSASQQKLYPQRRILLVLTPPHRGASQRCRLFHTSHLHTEVVSFHVHRHTVRLKHSSEGVCNLPPQPLLHRKALRKQPDQPRDLGNSDDMLVSDISDISKPVKRQRVVLTERKKRDGAFNDLAQAAV